MEINIAIKRELDREFIGDIFTTAFYGGITYWCEKADNTYDSGHVVSAVLHIAEEDDETVTVTTEGIIEAISKIMDGTYPVRLDIREAINKAIIDNDCGNIDADGADVIVQYAGFKELVYG